MEAPDGPRPRVLPGTISEGHRPMHEMSIARNIVEIVDDVIRDHPGKRVAGVLVSIGRMVGVVHDSLRFSFEAITSDSPALAGAALSIDVVDGDTLVVRQIEVEE